MTEKPTATEVVNAMLTAANRAPSASAMPRVGTFAVQYGDAHREDVTAETVQAFLHGSTIINLLVQESILKVTRVASEVGTEADDDESRAYAAGVQEGAMLIAQLMAANADQIIGNMIEGPAYDRAFQQIVQNY
jgi:hypothetical protein